MLLFLFFGDFSNAVFVFPRKVKRALWCFSRVPVFVMFDFQVALGQHRTKLVVRCVVRFFGRLPRNSAGILPYGKGFLGNMTENLHADCVQSRQAGFVRCRLRIRPDTVQTAGSGFRRLHRSYRFAGQSSCPRMQADRRPVRTRSTPYCESPQCTSGIPPDSE